MLPTNEEDVGEENILPMDRASAFYGVPVQRDWLGHAIQVAAIVVVIGIPAIVWASATSRDLGTYAARIDGHDREIAAAEARYIRLESQMIQANGQLATVIARIDAVIRDLGAGLAALGPIRLEHEVIDDQMAFPSEQIG